MLTTLLIFHLLLALAIVGVVLLQRSEGGALGIGGGGDGLKGGRTPSNPLVKLTAFLGIGFFVTSIFLTLFVNYSTSILDRTPEIEQPLSIPKPVEQEK